MERNPWFRSVLVLLATLGILWLLRWVWDLAGLFADVILLFFLAWLLAFIMYPLADWAAEIPIPLPGGSRPLSHGPAVGLVYLGLILVLVLMGVLLVPLIVAQAVQLGANLPAYVGQLPTVSQLQDELARRGIPVEYMATIYKPDMLLNEARSVGGLLAQNALSIAAGVLTTTFNLLIVLILSFYFMLDGCKIADELLGLVPDRYKEEADYFVSRVTRTFGGFIRGQLLQAIIYGMGTAIVMWIAGTRYVAVVSTFSGLAMIIPFIGPFLAIIPPVALAAVQSPDTLPWVFLALFVLQQVVTNIIAPKIMSESVGMHPLLVFLAMMIGVKIAGFWGALFGVPVVGVIYAMSVYLYQQAAEDESARKKGRAPALRSGPAARRLPPDRASERLPTSTTSDPIRDNPPQE